jgi:hypothetical protein
MKDQTSQHAGLGINFQICFLEPESRSPGSRQSSNGARQSGRLAAGFFHKGTIVQNIVQQGVDIQAQNVGKYREGPGRLIAADANPPVVIENSPDGSIVVAPPNDGWFVGHGLHFHPEAIATRPQSCLTAPADNGFPVRITHHAFDIGDIATLEFLVVNSFDFLNQVQHAGLNGA